MAKRVFIIHGWDGSPGEGWFPWIKYQLESRGFAVHIPEMPGGEHPHLYEWLSMIKKVVGKPDKDTYFIGHSLGCITIVKYLESLSFEEKIGGCVFVAGFSFNTNIPEIREFFETSLEFSKVRVHTKKFTTIFSTNDDVVSIREGKKFQQLLDAKLIVMENRGHYSGSDGITEVPEVLSEVLQMAEKNN